jgi:predicted metal-dependent peptidase
MDNSKLGHPAGDKITKAIASMVLDKPFYGIIIMRLAIVHDDNVRTMATDGEKVLYNEAFTIALSLEECIGVLAHEVMHIVLLHHLREMGRDHQKWNEAADYAINPLLLDDGMKLPSNVLYEQKYRGMSAEEIYDALPDQPSGSGEGRIGDVIAPSNGGRPLTPSEIRGAEESMARVIVQASALAKKAGKMPASLERLVSEIYQPRLNWRALLREFLDRIAKNDFSFSRPNPRYVYTGAYVPQIISREIGRLLVAIDTSGSISNEDFCELMGEVDGILSSYDCTVTLVQCDAKVHSSTELRDGDPLPKKLIGGGGTRFTPVFEFAEKMTDPPKAIIYLTDGYGQMPKTEPEIPVIWLSSSRKKFPFGTVVMLRKEF